MPTMEIVFTLFILVLLGKRLPASYVNFYFANNSVIVPGFGDIDQDQRALETFQVCMMWL